MISDFQMDRATTLIQTIIVEFGLLFGLFALTGTQKTFINRYNYVEKTDDKKTNNKDKKIVASE